MRTLGIETSSDTPGACLVENGKVIKEETLSPSMNINISEIIVKFFDKIYQSYTFDIVSVDVGPGGFTGIRLGVCMAKTISQLLKKTIIPVNSLETLAYSSKQLLKNDNFAVCSLVKFLRDEAFVCCYKFDKRCLPIPLMEEKLLTINKIMDELKRSSTLDKIVFVGNAAIVYKDVIKKNFPKSIILDTLSLPTPADVGLLGEKKALFRRKKYKFYEILPMYLRPPEAEIRYGKFRYRREC
jgi:tRNA threonylcarbamoyladenosine biosynthesis protein TsaB